MDLDRVVLRFEHNSAAIVALAAGIDDRQARWKPSLDDWSILEVINHLYDEEREDFRTRLDLILHRQEEDWPPIHPAAWAVDRRYNERDLDESLQNFLAERQNSLQWLRSLLRPNWEFQSIRPSGHTFSAGDMLSSWLAHDHLHIRQLNELHYLYHVEQVEPYRVEYAGAW